MLRPRSNFFLVTALTVLCLTTTAAHALNLPRIFSDNMVLQGGLPLKIWGWTAPGQSVEVSFSAQKKITKAAEDGKWAVTLDPFQASADPADLSIVAGDQRVSIKNILVGEVWLCSGQSNMEYELGWNLGDTNNARETIASAN